jgi:hypothetical protein
LTSINAEFHKAYTTLYSNSSCILSYMYIFLILSDHAVRNIVIHNIISVYFRCISLDNTWEFIRVESWDFGTTVCY